MWKFLKPLLKEIVDDRLGGVDRPASGHHIGLGKDLEGV